MLFRNRTDAGRRLARQLERYIGRADVVVLALPRGGVPVGFEIARALKAPLDVFLVRKLGVPGQEELAMGALASGGVRVINESLVRRLGVPAAMIEEVAAREERELARRERAYRGTNPPLPVAGRTVILVDDGLATGASLQAAAMALKRQGPARIAAAVPVGAAETCAELRDMVDEIVCAETPEPFWAVGNWYDDFSQTTDEEVRSLLARARAEEPARDGERLRAPEHARSR
jgi:putative phosphoribosyl transferase